MLRRRSENALQRPFIAARDFVVAIWFLFRKHGAPLAWHSVLEDNREYVRAIGMISIESTNVDIFLGRLLSAILNIPPATGQAIYLAPKSATLRVEILEVAAKQTFKPTFIDITLDVQRELNNINSGILRKINNIISQSRSTIGRRHDVIHVVWGQDKDDMSIVAKMTTKDIVSKTPPKIVHINELNKLISDMRNIIDDVRPLMSDLLKRNIDRHLKMVGLPPIEATKRS